MTIVPVSHDAETPFAENLRGRQQIMALDEEELDGIADAVDGSLPRTLI
ncbi:hypothetical protein X768_22885 [Mesorhizobium sp. LSJC265A00]|nr:hypothetical protein X768_22885 [Mesorhizobium sp. LSJC265A00]